MTPKTPTGTSASSQAATAFNAGNALCRAGRIDQGIVEYRKALALRADYVEALNNLANALLTQGRLAEAIASLRRATAVRPDYAPAWSNLARSYREDGQIDAGIDAAKRAIALAPQSPEPLVNLSVCLADARRVAEAVEPARRAIALRGDYVEAHIALGNALRQLGEFDESIALLRRAVLLRPGFAYGLNNLALALADADELEEAIAVHREATAAAPDLAGMRWNLGFALLKAGQLREGFLHHEARHRVVPAQSPARSFGQQWEGEELASRTILLYAEQGTGDTIQFIRYLPMVVGRGGRVIIECQPALNRLMAGLPGVAGMVLPEKPLPAFDVHCPLLTLPAVFGTTLETIPAEVPYLRPDPKLSQSWAGRVGAAADGRFKIGLCWAGDPRHGNDRHRSIAPAEFAPLAKLPNVWFCNLQKRAVGATAEVAQSVAAELPPALAVTDWTAELGDFAETAALVENLDLVVCVDTAVAHLAGALGKRVFVLLSKPCDWRWLTGRDDTPWYPTMRLFRQSRPREWGEPMARTVEAIAAFQQSRQA